MSPQLQQDTDRPFIPNRQMLQFLNVFLSPDGPNTIRGCAERASVPRRTVYNWFESDAFRAWFHDQCSRCGATERELMWRNARRLAIAGSPEHIKLVAMKAGELIHPGANEHMRPAPTAVFINVPRPPSLPAAPDVGLEVQQLPELAGDVGLDQAQVATAQDAAAHNQSND